MNSLESLELSHGVDDSSLPIESRTSADYNPSKKYERRKTT